MKHAYLILAHNQFDILQILVSLIDDTRNDIYIHIDRKVEKLPEINTTKSKLIFIENRINVRWGNLSVVEAEYILMENAFYSKNEYRYYHLLSGVDLPLRNQDIIHKFFIDNDGKEFIGFNSNSDLKKELERKVNRIHLFSDNFKGSGLFFTVKRIIRAGFIRFQDLIGYRRYGNKLFKKGTQWFSITNTLLSYVLSNKADVMKTYKYTFCPDEIFIQTIAWNGHFIDRMYNIEAEGRGCMREIGWDNGNLIDYTMKDIDKLLKSDKLFARKFSNNNMDVISIILSISQQEEDKYG